VSGLVARKFFFWQHNRTTQDQSKMERTGDTCHLDAAAVRVECIVKPLLCASIYVS